MDQAEILEQHVPHLPPHDGAIILRQNAYADMRPFIEQLWEDRREMCCNIYLDQFPRGTVEKGATREEEDAFLLVYFSERDLHLQGGRFLKQVLYAIAKFNEDNVLSQAEKWWREHNFCFSSGMDAIQIRQVLDLHEGANYPDSFLSRVVLLISDGFRRLHALKDQPPITATDMESALPTQKRGASAAFVHDGMQSYKSPIDTHQLTTPGTAQAPAPVAQHQQRHRAVSIQGTSLLHGHSHGQPYSGRPRQFHKQEYRGRGRRPSASNFPDFNPNIGFVDPQSHAPPGFPMQPDGRLVANYPPTIYAPVEPRMPPNHGYPRSAYYPDGDIMHQRSGSFNRRGGRPRLVDPHSYIRYDEPQWSPYRGGHRASFGSNRARRSSIRSSDAWQGPRETRLSDRRVHSDRHRDSVQTREARSHSDVAVDSKEDVPHSDTGLAIVADEQAYIGPILPSLSEDGSADNETEKQQDSSPKTIEDDSFQTAVETPTATPTENALYEKAHFTPSSPASPVKSDEDASENVPEDTPVDTHLSKALIEEKLHGRKVDSIPASPTTTTESGDTANTQSAGHQLTAPKSVSKSGPKQTESFSPFARRANTKKEPKQKPGKSKTKRQPEQLAQPEQSEQIEQPEQFEQPVQSEHLKQHILDASVDAEVVREEHIESKIESNDGPVVSTANHVAENLTKQNENDVSHQTRANIEDRTESQNLSAKALSSVTAMIAGALNSMSSSNKSNTEDDLGSAISQPETPQPEVESLAPKKKSKNKNKKKKKKAKATITIPDDTSTETLANETPVASPPSHNKFSLRESTNALDKRLSLLNIREGSIVELHENVINYHTTRPVQQENLSFFEGSNEVVEQSRRKLDAMDEKERLIKQKKK
jgi:hypothetical protein